VRQDDDGSYWAEVADLPGCFASARTLDELKEVIVEAICLYLADHEHPDIRADVIAATVDEIRVAVPA
jgi:predicted RNase H-like HicB family nuclease